MEIITFIPYDYNYYKEIICYNMEIFKPDTKRIIEYRKYQFKQNKEINEMASQKLLENILIMNDFTDIVRPQKGVAQHGVDFSAKKNGTLYLFVLKQKDIDKNNWNSGNNAVRPTLDEIQDVYIPERIKEFGSKINIVVCTMVL